VDAKKKSPGREKDGRKPRNYPPIPSESLDTPPNHHRNIQAHGQNQLKPPDNPGATAYAAFWRGVGASQEQQWQKAQEWFREALSGTGKLPEAHFGRGVARYHLKNYQGAIQDFLLATQQLPDYALASLWLGKAWEQLGNSTQAQKAFMQAVKQNPDLKEAWFSLGVLAYREGHLTQAQIFLERSGNEIEEAARRAYYLGAIARSQGRLEQAQRAFADAIELDTELFPAYLEQGKTLLELGQPKKAAKVLTELIQREPKSTTARYYLALAHLAAWDTKGAWEQYFVLQKQNPALASKLLPALEKGL
jgi:tetratricopeptide (TPR) repeat protein